MTLPAESAAASPAAAPAAPCTSELTAPPTRLRVEHARSGERIGRARPRFSWWLPAASASQKAWEIELSTNGGGAIGHEVRWLSGRRESSESVLVSPGPDAPSPRSGENWQWRVRVWTDLGESAWSSAAPWNVGLLDGESPVSAWIEPYEAEIPAAGKRPGYALRREFTLAADVAAATAYVTAHGVYELFVNGVRVGDAELTPGFTSYRSRLQVQTYDVASLLHEGDNVLGILLTDGWFRGRHGFERHADGFGDKTAVLLDLVCTGADGSATLVGTDQNWRSAPSDILSADLMDGEVTGAVLPGNWSKPGFAADGWSQVYEQHDGLYSDRERLTTSVAPPVRRIREVAPRSITRLANGAHVIDFGENLNGWVRLSNPGSAGSTLTLTHGETTDATGAVSTENIRAFDFRSGTPLPAGQIDTVDGGQQAGGSEASGAGFEPRHTTHGFQFVQVDGYAGELTADDIVAVVVHSDLEETGSFECSDQRVNLLHAAGVRSFLANACDIPTDCPQRERSGFTGDWQIYVETAAFTHDVAGFSDKWLRDLAADQWVTGVVPNIVPDPNGNGPSGKSFTDMTNGSAGWGDAAVIVPWRLWQQYGDREILERQYGSMTAWVDYAADQAASKRHPDRVAAHPEREPHEQYLWDTGFHFGEWLEPNEVPVLDPNRDNNGVATAYLAHSAWLLARIATELGRDADAARYRELADGARDAWQHEQLTRAGDLVVQTQAMHVRALAFGLVPNHLIQRTADRLAHLVSSADFHLGTGFLSTGMLLGALADHGHPDVAYRLLFSVGEPSWLGMIDRGCTTIWERWNGIDDAGVADGSLNHYSKGAVLSFLHQYVAGIRPGRESSAETVGYRRFRVVPRPGGGITSAEATHDGPHGRIRSAWVIDDGELQLSIDVPPASAATVELPDGTTHECGPGTHRLRSRLNGQVPASALTL